MKKKILLAITGLFTVMSSYAQLQTITDAGAVTTNPIAIESPIVANYSPANMLSGGPGLTLRSTANNINYAATLRFSNFNANGAIGLTYDATRTSSLVFGTSVDGGSDPAQVLERMRIAANGNVGIGTAAPDGARLTVVQQSSNSFSASFGRGLTLSNFQRGIGYSAPVLITGVTNASNDGYTGMLMLGSSYLNEAPGQYLGVVEFLQPTTGKSDGNASSKAGIYAISTGSGGSVAGYGGMLQFATRPDNSSASPWNAIHMVIDQNGLVGIGTTAPDSKLTVAGNIHSREVKVSVNAGADYVFQKEYALRPLKEVETYITQNQHLPEIASAKEMKEKGIELGDMNMKLLKKIEELTLYMIHLKKENEQIKTKFESQQRQINQLVKKAK